MGQNIESEIPDLTHIAVSPENFPSGQKKTCNRIVPLQKMTEVAMLHIRNDSRSKGAKHTDASIAAIGDSMGTRLDVQEGDRPALVFPFPHIGGLTWLFTALQSGATLLCDAAFDPSTTTAFLSSENCTHPGAGTPFHMAYLAAQRKQPETKLFPNVKNFPAEEHQNPSNYILKSKLN